MNHMITIFDYGRNRISFTDRRLFNLLEGGIEPVTYTTAAPVQATGQPDSVDASTYGNSWWPSSSEGEHWLELTFAEPINCPPASPHVGVNAS